MSTQLPPGWAAHPQNPAYAYNLQNPADVREVARLVAPAAAAPPATPPAPVPQHPSDPAWAYSAAAPPAAPPAPVPQLPPGWTLHPSDPAWAYSAQGQVVEVRVLLQQSQVQVPPQAQAAALPAGVHGAAEWGEQSVEQAAAAAAASEVRDGVLWLDFPEMHGGEVSMLLRFLPAWAKLTPGRNAWVDQARHCVSNLFVKNNPMRGENTWVECPQYSETSNRLTCPICAVVERLKMVEGVRDMAVRRAGLWQVLNLSNPQIHYQVVGGQNLVVPAVFRAGKQLHDAILAQNRVCETKNGGSGNHFTSPLAGFPIEVVKKRGKVPAKGLMNIEYDATHHAHQAGPIDPRIFPSFLYDLIAKCQYWRPMAELEEIAAAISAAYSPQAQPSQPPAVPASYVPAGGYPAAPGAHVPPPASSYAAPPPSAYGHQAAPGLLPPPPPHAAPGVLPAPPPVAAAPAVPPPAVGGPPPLPAGALPPPRAPGLGTAPPAPVAGNPPPGMPGGYPGNPNDDIPF